jgi:hypothetical protein
MDLNLPSAEPLLDCRNLLIAGLGGGFDIFCGLPVYFELSSRSTLPTSVSPMSRISEEAFIYPTR